MIKNKLETFLEENIEQNKNLIVVFDINGVNGYVNKELIEKNLKKIINVKNYKVLTIDILKYKKDIDNLFEKKINKVPFVLKYENKEIVQAFDTFLNI